MKEKYIKKKVKDPKEQMFYKSIIRNGVLLGSFIYMFACNIPNDNNEIITTDSKYINQPSRSVNTLKHEILFNGAENSYMELYNSLIVDQANPEEFLFWALIWANKYDKPEGYYDVYSCLVESCYSDTTKSVEDFYPLCYEMIEDRKVPSFNHLDINTRNLAFKYLKIAAEKGSENAKNEIKKIKPIIDLDTIEFE